MGHHEEGGDREEHHAGYSILAVAPLPHIDEREEETERTTTPVILFRQLLGLPPTAAILYI